MVLSDGGGEVVPDEGLVHPRAQIKINVMSFFM
jgi:hypothetical protein